MTDTNDMIKPNPEKNIKLKLTQRQVNIALNKLRIDGYNVDLPNDLGYLNATCNDLKLDESYRDSLAIFSKANVLPDESIVWLQDDLRAALWFDHYSYYDNKGSFQWKNYSADFQSNLITCFDLTNIRLPHRDKAKLFDYKVEWKRDFINKAKGIYNNIRTMPQDLEWLDSKNEKQILWAHSYLGTHGHLIQNPLFLCNDLSAYYMQICASLDALDTSNRRNSRPYKMTLFKKDVLNKMRNAWSQKKFRDKKDAETAQEYFLTRRHMNKLKKLADGYGLSSKEYLQQLIDEAYNSID